jgi:nicotinamidase-related amidase
MTTEFPPVPLNDSVLVLTHLQNEFWHPDGRGYAFTKETLPFPDTLERISSLVATARAVGMPIIFHNETFRPGHPEIRIRRNGYVRGSSRVLGLDKENMAVRGEWGAATLESLKPRPGFDEFEFDNAKVDPFTCTEFEVLLRNLERNTLILAGLSTNLGIEMTARSASDRDYGVVVLSDCTDRMFGEYSEMTMTQMLPYFGRVMTSDVLRDELENQA